MLAGIALAGAVYLSSLRLQGVRGAGYCTPGVLTTGIGPRGGCPLAKWKHSHTDRRAVWQIPVAIVIAAVGFGAALAVARTPRT